MDVILIPRADRASVAEEWDSIQGAYSDLAARTGDPLERQSAETAQHVYSRVYGIHKVDGVPSSVVDVMNGRGNRRFEGIHDLPSLNGLYLTSFLRRRGVMTRALKNFCTEKKKLAGWLGRGGPQLVAISSTFIYTDSDMLREISEFCRGLNPDVKLVYGGASLYSLRNYHQPADALGRFMEGLEGVIDYFILSESGELRLTELLEHLEQGRDPGRLSNLAWFDDSGRLVMNPVEPENIDIDEEFLDWHLVDDDQLHPIAFSWTSCGCPFRCKFCNFFKIHEQTGFRSPAGIARELRTLVERNPGVEHVIFTDDNFGIGSRRITELTRMLVDEDFPFTWSSFTRPDAINEDTIPLLLDSGCEALTFGVETADETILKSILKSSTPRKYLESINRCADAGIFPIGSFIVGLPGETAKTVDRLIEFVNGSGMKFLLPFVYHHQGDNDLFRDAEQHGISGLGPAWVHGTMNSMEAADEFFRLFQSINYAATDAPDIWGTFLALRGQGFDPSTIHRLCRAKNDITRAQYDRLEGWEVRSRAAYRVIDGVLAQNPAVV